MNRIGIHYMSAYKINYRVNKVLGIFTDKHFVDLSIISVYSK